MRLSGIKLAGFKSFVDPTQLPLPSNLTSVVGPNGCGKSNIIDAVRWVLGEASMKNLRGADSEDVIFNGSKTRKPVGRAAVELLFDNSDGQIAGPFAAYAEISVRRELTRDGNSQYFLNGRKCLKRDVTDLFLGTGLGGKNQYAIIEQGMVSRMIEAKPEELRQWLEEAAGISKYKDRRKETESRIRGTRENLARLNDLRAELTARLEVLGKQAANAEKYRELKNQERELRAQILALRARGIAEQSVSHQQQIEAAEQALAQAREALNQTAAERTRAEAAQRQAQQLIAQEQSKVYEAEGAQARAEQNRQHALELKQIKARELETLLRNIADLEARGQREEQRMAEAARQLQALDAQATDAASREAQAQSALVEAEDTLQEEQRRWDRFVHDAEAPLTQTEAERVRVQQLDRARFQTDERCKRLESEYAALNPQPIQDSLVEVDRDLAQLAQQLGDGQARLQNLDQELQAMREQRAGQDAALHESRQQLQSARGRMASLETLQQAALREDDAELSHWLQQQGWHQHPRLASQLQVEPGWEAAVEHVLDGLLQAPLLPDFIAQSQRQPQGPKTGAVLLDAQAGQPRGGLAAKVTGPQAVLDWLSLIQPVDSEAEALALAAQLSPEQSVITPQGTWRGRHWVRHPRTGDQQSGVIARAQLLKQLRLQVDAQAREVNEREQAAQQSRERVQRLEAERSELAAQVDQLRSRHGQRLAFRQAQAVRLEQMQSRQQALGSELDTLRAARAQQEQELDAARTRLVSLEDVAEQLRQQRTQLQQSLTKARDRVQHARSQLGQAQTARNELQIQLAGRRSALSALEQTHAEVLASREALLAQRGEFERQAAAQDVPLQALADAVEAARQAADAAREALRQTRQRVEAVEQGLVAAIEALRTAEQTRDSRLEQLQQARLEFENLRARGEALDAQIRETGLDRDALVAALPAEATAEAWEERLAGVLRRIERLGPINLAAIQELEEASERDRYLTAQHTDLHEALETLEAAIRKIDTETKELFRTTFDRVNTVFIERFPKLFGGGEAYLELTGDDLLETGVRVMARPPGKRNSSIQMLSGGEKAMTAVALLLALFQLNPAPFCLMDEVDAPLDDANVGRFCEVVREMSENVQFIIITHNKITMELAAQLHGVTMQEPGVSRLVSVDVEQAVALTGQTETSE
jgi:chromosome segregation protein